MSKNKPKRVQIAGSKREPLPQAKVLGSADSEERIQVTILVRRKAADVGLKAKIEEIDKMPIDNRQHLSYDDFAANYGADPLDIQKVENFAYNHSLDVLEVIAAQRRVVLSGTVANFSAAFAVDLKKYEHPKGTYRGRTGHVSVPVEIKDIVEGVFGLDDRPQVSPHMRLYNEQKAGADADADADADALAMARSYTPFQVGGLYNFPRTINGRGQCIAIIELGGGYRMTDLRAYFYRLGLPMPTVKSISVDGENNYPTGDPNGPDGEVGLDIEIAGATAPGVNMAVYFAPNTDAGFIDSIYAAIHDNINRPAVISISWGAPESDWTLQAMQAMDHAFQDAVALGITVCCAAGDNGSTDGVDDGYDHVDFPASSPHVLGCGGTKLVGRGNTIASETVWNEGPNGGATGGGVSEIFNLPSWQANANVPPSANDGESTGRGVPDVSGDADPHTGYQVLVDGRMFVVGGTSAVAPLWAALIALINKKLGKRVGFINPLLYSLPGNSGAFHDITVGHNDMFGDNGFYKAGPGWDACTGLGSPNGVGLLNALLTHK